VRESLKRMLSLLLVLALCLTMAPMAAADETEEAELLTDAPAPAISDTASVTITTDDGPFVLTTSKVVPESRYGSYLAAMVDTTGITEDSNWKISVDITDRTEWVYENRIQQCSWYLEEFPYGWQTVTFTVTDSTNAVIGSDELDLYFATQAEYPITDADIDRGRVAEVVTAGVIEVSASVQLAAGDGFVEGTEVTAELLDSTGRVVGETMQGRADELQSTTVEDSRFAAFFQDYVPYEAVCLSAYAMIYCGSALENGLYSLRLTNESGGTKMISNWIEVKSDLIADVYSGYNGYLSYDEETSVAGAVVRIQNGDPADFKVWLMQPGSTEPVAVSTSYRPIEPKTSHSEMQVQYYIPFDRADLSQVDEDALLEQFLQEHGIDDVSDMTEMHWAEFEALKAEMGGSTSLYDLTLKLVATNGRTVTGETETRFDSYSNGFVDNLSVFTNHFYANALLYIDGLDAGDTYKVELVKSNAVLGEAVFEVQEGQDCFDVEFRDAEGSLVQLEPYGQYQVRLYNKNYNGSWNFYVQTQLYNRNVDEIYAMSLMSAEDTVVLDVTQANVSLSGDRLSCYFRGESDVLAGLESGNYTLHLTPAGSDTAIVLDKKTYQMTGVDSGRAYIYFTPDEPLADGVYWAELHSGNKTVVDADGEKLFADYSVSVSSIPEGNRWNDSFMDSPLRLFYGARWLNAGPNDAVTLEFYAVGNRTATPDYTIDMGEDDLDWEHYRLTEEDVTALGRGQYQLILWVGDTPVAVEEYNYWVNDEWIDQDRSFYWQNGDYQYFDVSVASAIADQADVNLLASYGGARTDGALRAYSEVYVDITPKSGNILKYITVNGDPIQGRSFLLTEDDTVVSAVFEEAEKYSITTNIYDSDAYMTIRPDMASVKTNVTEAVEGETITLTVEPAEGYLLERASCGQVSLTKVEDGKWTFKMPDADVTINVYMRAKKNLSVNLYSSEGGTLTCSPMEGIMEGDTITLTATPNEGYSLVSLTASYNDSINSGYYNLNLVDTPTTAAFTQEITLPATYVEIRAQFAAMEEYKISSLLNDGGTVTLDKTTAYPGDPITFTVNTPAHYKLQEDTLYVRYSMNSATQSLKPTKNADGTWSFAMPWADAVIYGDFVVSGPGGTVTNLEELNVALGSVHTLNAETGTVELIEHVLLEKPVVISGSTGILAAGNWSNYTIALDEDATDHTAAFVLEENGSMTLKAGNIYNYAGTNGAHGILVQGGDLTVMGYTNIYSGEATVMDTSAAIWVEDGSLTLKEDENDYYPSCYGQSCGDGIRITGGDVVVEMARADGGITYVESYDAGDLSLQGGEEIDWDPDAPGGSGIHVSDTGNLRIEDGMFISGLNQAGLKISKGDSETFTGTVEIKGGYCNCIVRGSSSHQTGYGAGLWVQNRAENLTITGGEYYTGSNYNRDESILLKNAVMADYLAPHYELWWVYDDASMDPNQSVYYNHAKVIPGESQVLAGTVEDKLAELEQIIDPEEKKNLVEEAKDAVADGMDDMNSEQKTEAMTNTALTEQIQKVEEQMVANDMAAAPVVSGEATDVIANAAITGALLNAQDTTQAVTLTVEESEEKEIPEGYQQDGVRLSLSLENVVDADTDVAGTQLNIPVVITLTLPETVNPAYVKILHCNAAGTYDELHFDVQKAENGSWLISFVADSFSDFILAEAIHAETTNTGVQVTVRHLHDENVTMACAVYDVDGKQLAVELLTAAELTAQEDQVSLTCDPGKAHSVKLFLLDGENAPAYEMETLVVTK